MTEPTIDEMLHWLAYAEDPMAGSECDLAMRKAIRAILKAEKTRQILRDALALAAMEIQERQEREVDAALDALQVRVLPKDANARTTND